METLSARLVNVAPDRTRRYQQSQRRQACSNFEVFL